MLAPYLLPELKQRYKDVNVLKKDNSYFSITCELFNFKDAYRFTSPVTLSKYLAQNGVTEKKSIFPYSAYNSVEELRNQKEFPDYELFYSELKGANVPKDDYDTASAEYNRRLSLPAGDPKKINSFVDWLISYNLLDTIPLAKAVNRSFQNFFDIFHIDPSWCLSLPRFAQMCMLKEYEDHAALCYSFNSKMDDIRELFRSNLMGGLVNVYHRMTDLTGQTDVPHASQFAPNGDPFTRISFYDFNSLYLYTQQLEFPSTPGILWSKHKGYFVKKIMAHGCSLGATQWLFYIQETCDDLIDDDGNRSTLQHMYYRGEKQFEGYKIDGYAFVKNQHIFYEYLGCYHHPGCPYCGKGGVDLRWEQKEKVLRSRGKLHVMRECIWKKELREKSLRHFHIPYFPLIMNVFGTQKELLNAMKNRNIFGFCVCDVHTPTEIYEKIRYLNFPPIIRRESIDEDLLSPYMLSRCRDRGYKLPQKTLIQCYNGTQMLLFTPLISFYMDLGLEISNVTKFIQYRPGVVFNSFVKKITNGRIEAKKAKNESLELAYKIIGNRCYLTIKMYFTLYFSGYGKMGECVKRYTNTRLGNDKRLKREMKSAHFKDANILTMENGEHDIIEIDMRPRKIADSKPIVMAKSILQNSKLHFLNFIYNVLGKYLIPGSFVLNYADTDSICICKLILNCLSKMMHNI